MKLLPLRPNRRPRRSSAWGNRTRRGVVTLEFILWFPVLVIALLAVVEFSLILTGAKSVAFASRTGAKLAAETANLASSDQATADSILIAVNNQLQSTGFGVNAAKGICLQYNTAAGSGTVVSSGGSCPAVANPVLPSNCVRVNICVDLSKFTPDLLSMYGFSTNNRTIELCTTLPYEE